MPFKKLANGTYVSPSGKVWTAAQVKAYHAGKFDHPPQKKSPPNGPQRRTLDK